MRGEDVGERRGVRAITNADHVFPGIHLRRTGHVVFEVKHVYEIRHEQPATNLRKGSATLHVNHSDILRRL